MKLLVIIPIVFLCTTLALPVIDPTDLRLSVRFDAEPARFFERESVELLRRDPPQPQAPPNTPTIIGIGPRRPNRYVVPVKPASMVNKHWRVFTDNSQFPKIVSDIPDNPPPLNPRVPQPQYVLPPRMQQSNAGTNVQGQQYPQRLPQQAQNVNTARPPIPGMIPPQQQQHFYPQVPHLPPQFAPAPAPYMVPHPIPVMIVPHPHFYQPAPHFPPPNAPTAHYIGQPPMHPSMIPPQHQPPYPPDPRLPPQDAYSSRPTTSGVNPRRDVPRPPAPDIPPTPPPPARLPPKASPPPVKRKSL